MEVKELIYQGEKKNNKMGNPKIIKSSSGDICHPCVGAVIIRDAQILMIERKKFPPGWACVAGHIDETDSTPEEALGREIKEESGLLLTDFKLLFQEEIKNPCSKGVDYHYWYVYDCKVDGNIIKNEEETKNIKWVDLDKVHRLNLEPVWKYIFRKINL
jgi:8-oxo-dGTP pyrophosphatase MutT (NUDIX family)